MSGFGLDHLPYGVFSVGGGAPAVGVRYGDGVLDLAFETGRPELAEQIVAWVTAHDVG